MTRGLKFSPGEFYHLYNRGTDKRIIFKQKSDYDRFMILLYLSNGTESFNLNHFKREGKLYRELYTFNKTQQLVNIGAYCLMPNHFHILVQERDDNGISRFMKKLSTAYSMYFNTKYERTGGLFEGAFKATHANNDRYLKYLFAYIHLNPVKIIDPQWKENGIRDKKKAESYLKNYHYSSYCDYIGDIRQEKNILNKEPFPEYFDEKGSFKTFVTDWLNYNDSLLL